LNLDLILRIISRLRSYAVIGAYALAARGYVRQTRDFDLLTTDRAALDPKTWDDIRRDGIRVDQRKGDSDDPLAGVVRFQGETLIDLVIAKYKWQDALIERAEALPVESTTLRIPRPADLILLKLFAGGPGDLHDIVRLLDIGPRQLLIEEVSDALAGLPDDMRSRWELMMRESRQT
jgi:hypothetical protein